MENYQLAKIYDRGGDLSKRWYVEYKFKHPETKKFQDFPTWISGKLLTKEARYKKAIEIKNNINSDLKSGYSPFDAAERKTLLMDAIDLMVKIKKKTCEPKTHSSYKSMCGKFKAWLQERKLHRLYPDEFTEAAAYDFLDGLLTVKDLSNCTRNCYLMCMKTIFNDLRRRKYFKISVWMDIKKLKVTPPDLVLYDEAERNLVRSELPKLHYSLYCVSLLIYNCFLRPAEIMRLKIKDFDFVNNCILVQARISKNKKLHYVSMPGSLVETLLKIDLNGLDKSMFLFSNHHALTPSFKKTASTRISEVWKEIVIDGLGVQKHIYDLKHNGNSAASESGINARQIQLQNRHHSLEQTQQYLDRICRKPNEAFRLKMPAF